MSRAEFGKVAVMMGGHSAEREVSLKSGQAILNALQAQGIEAVAFDPAQQPLQALLEQNIDRVFIALHGRGGEDGSMQGALQTLGLPYTGSGILGCALAMDKVRTKQIWQAMGLPVADSVSVSPQQRDQIDTQQVMADLGGRVIVKPANEGSSIGMSVANDAEQLATALDIAFQYDQQVLVERWIVGKEYTVGLLAGEALPVIRLQTPHEFYDFAAKYQANDTQYHCPAGLSAEDEQHLQQLAVAAFAGLGCRGWGRIDAMRDEQGNWYLLEANAVPGMTEKSLVPMAAKARGDSFSTLVENILAQTLES
ncbi:D-alanine--D-alanine ligase [Idiomarina sp. OT37-5b]|jgi:D-alanine-D-alanine ligase|uniref:D-alanine--D-alanine ligase n=1 Tax=Idiomarina aquatica TaxID=1327752 RepID=A0AA94EHC2_9GAMM|nr:MULTISPECIES: D-alanine--D-alanine ligase [Idiomarina]AVJ55131.1 D-alanine--D-alanine ligase [Idiomarina sp. OT37-5b]RUO45339.1 D-alanine--D-alanine ligase [Idiomarina aquatica]